MPDDGYFDEGIAARYDDSSVEVFEPALVNPVVDCLVELAGDGRALELSIGTRRIALPLARRGVPVHGIDMSNAMVARPRAKPGGEEIDVTIGVRYDIGGWVLLRRIPCVQHDYEPDDPGGADCLFP